MFYIWATHAPSKLIHTDFLIIGQGIAGTLLSYELMNSGKKVLVMDNADPHKSSLVAGAVLNPMAGKHWSPSPQASTFLPKAIETYRQIEKLLDFSVLDKTELLVFHESEEKRHHFEHQQKEHPSYFKNDNSSDHPFFNADFGCGVIRGLHKVDALTLLHQWQYHLQKSGSFMEGEFDFNDLEIMQDQIRYQDIIASKIVFCTGAAAMLSPYFSCLPFTKNRGEALIVSIPGLPTDTIYHKQLRLIPRNDDLFWCGSNYTWDFENLLPNEAWKANAIKDLEQWLNISFEVKDHIVAQRPTTAGQVPIVSIHPQYKNVAILNGLGTRGFSAGPYWASELAKQLF